MTTDYQVAWAEIIETHIAPKNYAGHSKVRSRVVKILEVSTSITHFIAQDVLVDVDHQRNLTSSEKSNTIDYNLMYGGKPWSILPRVVQHAKYVFLNTATPQVIPDTPSPVDDTEDDPVFIDYNIVDQHVQLLDTDVEELWYSYCIDGNWSHTQIHASVTREYFIPIKPIDLGYIDIIQKKNVLKIYRMHLSGKPGLATGRSIWSRNNLYHPRFPKELAWKNILLPLSHPAEVERLPKILDWDVLDIVMEQADWNTDAREILRHRFPHAQITTVGHYESDADIWNMKPYQLQDLKHKSYHRCTLGLFENTGEKDWANLLTRRIKLLDQHQQYANWFVENNWHFKLGSNIQTSQYRTYGYGYSFHHGSAHDYTWESAQRDARLRQTRDSLSCNRCSLKSSCDQYLSSAYVHSGNVEYPLKDNNACLLRKINRLA